MSVAATPAWRDREPRGALIVCAAVAVVLHAAALPLLVFDVVVTPPEAVRVEVDVPQAPPLRDEEELTLGDEESKVSSVAWISHDDFRELLARRTDTLQPALQQMVEPTEAAPPELDPTPPAPTAAQQATPQAAVLAPLTPPRPDPASANAAKELLRLPDASALANVRFAPLAGDPDQGEAIEQDAPTPQPVEPTPPTPAVAAAPTQARPTSSPLSDREAPPTTIYEDSLVAQPGRVIAAPGLEIKTTHPRFSAVTLASTLPSNPTAVITFDRTGQVIDVRLKRSSGAENVDGPVIASLYQWRASGERIEALRGHLEIEIKLLFVRE